MIKKMKLVDFLKRFEGLEYDENTELDIFLLHENGSINFLNIYDIGRNQDCSNINSIGIVLRNMGE